MLETFHFLHAKYTKLEVYFDLKSQQKYKLLFLSIILNKTGQVQYLKMNHKSKRFWCFVSNL